MTTMTSAEIRAEIAKREGCSEDCVKCYYCHYWGWNRGKDLNSMAESRCTARTKKTFTWSRQFCRKFKLNVKK